MVNKSELDYRLYLVTDRPVLNGRDLYTAVEQAILGGVTFLQLREKKVGTRQFYQLALRMKELAVKHSIPFVINDRVDIAVAVDADGLHIGQEDLPLEVARKILGPEKIIGVSASTIEEACLAEAQGADYLGVGAVFPTATKQDADSVGLEGLKQIQQAVKIPVVAIGGIDARNIGTVINSGVAGVAVVSAILGQEDCKGAALNLW